MCRLVQPRYTTSIRITCQSRRAGREAVSLYVERPYKPQWRVHYYCPPEEILLEIERRLGPDDSDLWRPERRPEESSISCVVNGVRKVVAMPFLVVGAIFDAAGEKILGE